MRVLDRRTYVAKQSQTLGYRKTVPVAVFVDRRALHQLHDEIRNTVIGRISIEQMSNVGMIQAGQNLPLVSKTLEDKSRVEAAPHELNRDFLCELSVGAHRAINLSHPARTDLFQNAVAGNNPS